MNERQRREYANALSWMRYAKRTKLVVDPDIDESRPVHVTVVVSNVPRVKPEPELVEEAS